MRWFSIAANVVPMNNFRTIDRQTGFLLPPSVDDTAMADMDGSGRCSGRSPITISTTTRSGATASASGPMATAISMPGSLRLTARMILRAMGYDKVYNVGGFKDWTGAVEKV